MSADPANRCSLEVPAGRDVVRPRRPWTAMMRFIVALAAGGAGVASAQTNISWNLAGGGNWNSSGNWSPGNVPNSTSEVAVFNQSGGGTITYNISGTTNLGGITFNSNAGAYTITRTGSAYTLNIGAYGINQNDGTGQTITGSGIRLSLAASTSFNVNAGGDLTISTTGGSIATTASVTLTLGGDGTGLGTISSQISGAGLLTKSGDSTWVLSSSSNNYTGGTNIADGTLVANAANALGTSGNIAFTGGTLRYGTGITTDYSSRIATSTGPIAIDTNGNNVTFASALAANNTGGLTKSGTGTLTLSAANSYTGETTVTNGTLALSGSGTLGANTNALTVSGGTLDLGGLTRTVGTTTISGGTIQNGTLTSSSNYAGQSGSVSAILGGSGALNKTTSGTLTLSGANTYTGGTTVSDGTLVLSGSGTLGASTNTLTVSGGTLDLGGLTRSVGTTTISGGTIQNGTLTSSANYAGQSGSVSAILGGSVALNKTTSGTLTLSGANTYSGGTTLDAGTLAVGNNSALGSGTLTINGGTLAASGGARSLSNAVTLAGDFAIGGTQDLTLTGGIALGGGDRTITVDNTGTTTFAGNITQPWYSGIIKAGDGRLVLSGSNGFTGTTVVNDGTLALTNSAALGGSTWGNVVANGATLELSNNISVTEGGFTIAGSGHGSAGAINNLSGTNTLAGQVVLSDHTTIKSTAGQLTLASYTDIAGYNLTVAGAGNTIFSSQINGTSGALLKSDSGTLTLSSANSYQGGTTLAGGTIVANNAAALAYDGNITFTGGTLRYGTGITTDWSARIANSSSAIAIDTNGNNVTFATSLANTNTGGLAKSGSGTLTLATANSYTGATSVTGGTLQLQNSGAIGTGAVSVSGGGTLQLSYSGTNSNSNNLTLNNGTLLNSTGTNSWLGNITLAGGGTITNNSASEFAIENASRVKSINMGANTLTVGGTGDIRIYSRVGVTGDTGNFVKNGSGTVTFYGYENFYTGNTIVNQGTLVLDTANSYNDKTILGNLIIGDGTHSATVLYGTGSADNKIKDASSVTINAGSLLDLNGRRDTIGALNLNGGTVDTRNVSGQQGILTLAGDVTVGGSSASTINGYQFSLNDQNNAGNVRNFTVADATGSTASDLTINSQVVFGGINKLGTGTMTLTGNNTYGGETTVSAGVLNIRNNTALGAVAGGTTVNTNAALELQNNITVGNEQLTLSGNGFNGSGGALRNVSGSNTWNGAVVLAADARITTDAASTLTLNGTITSSTDKNVIFDSVGTTYATNAIGTGNGGVTKESGGTLYLSGNSTYHGATTINAGVVNISHNNALGATDGGTTVANGAALELQGNIQVGAESLSLTGSGISSGGALRNVSGNNQFGGVVTVTGSTASIRADAGSLTLSGGVATGGNALTIGGAANTTISGALTGTSAGSITKIDSSTLTISSANNSGFAGNVNINSGTLLMAANNALNNAAVDVAVNGGTFSLQTYAQTIGSLSGTGTVDFGAGDGITTFSSLTLLADSTFSGTFTGTGRIIVGAGVTLTLGNDFNASGVTIVLAGGTLNVNGSDSTFAGLTLTGNSTIDFDSSDDSIIRFTTLSLGSYSLAVSGWADEQDYFLVNNDPGNKATAPLNQVSFANSGPWVGNDTIWTGDYSGYSYNNEVRPWKPVPEPSTYGAILMGVGLAFFGYRRWRQQRAAK